MTKNLPAIPDQEKRIASVLHLHQIVMAAASQMAVAAAKAGLEFKALKKEVGHGAWEEFYAKNFASTITLRTAQKYMALADGLKGKALKNESAGSFLKLLECAPSALSKTEQATLTKAVAKATDGKALSDLYQDFGIVKKPQGSGAKGGNTHKDKPEATEPGGDSTTADTPPTASEIPANVDPRAWKLNQLLEEALLDGWWNDCPVEFRKTLHGNLVDAGTRVGATLKKGTS
ncbi:MAG: hypothetical protein NTV51_14575 [Verrucomicrobia bacterium]|nr:hypothetical protein [Verrucomicrobiota bacterium]